MKKFLSLILVLALFVSVLSLGVSAQGTEDILISRTEEVLDNGDVIITELYENALQPRTGKNGYKVYTYTSGGKTIWTLTVDGSFEYTYGVSSEATGAKATVRIYDSSATYVSKNAYVFGNTATATGTVYYYANITRSVSVSCDRYGNLS